MKGTKQIIFDTFFGWLQWDSNSQPLKSKTNTEPFN